MEFLVELQCHQELLLENMKLLKGNVNAALNLNSAAQKGLAAWDAQKDEKGSEDA